MNCEITGEAGGTVDVQGSGNGLITTNAEVIFSSGVALESGGAVDAEGSCDGLIPANSEVVFSGGVALECGVASDGEGSGDGLITINARASIQDQLFCDGERTIVDADSSAALQSSVLVGEDQFLPSPRQIGDRDLRLTRSQRDLPGAGGLSVLPQCRGLAEVGSCP